MQSINPWHGRPIEHHAGARRFILGKALAATQRHPRRDVPRTSRRQPPWALGVGGGRGGRFAGGSVLFFSVETRRHGRAAIDGCRRARRGGGDMRLRSAVAVYASAPRREPHSLHRTGAVAASVYGDPSSTTADEVNRSASFTLYSRPREHRRYPRFTRSRRRPRTGCGRPAKSTRWCRYRRRRVANCAPDAGATGKRRTRTDVRCTA